MKKMLLLGGLVLALLEHAHASGGGLFMTSRTFICDGSQKIRVAYVRVDQAGPSFAILNWKGQPYGLAQALSASGARYAGLFGPPGSGGLEWWEHQGQATLNTFVSTDTRKTRPLLTSCKPDR
ncbi:MliC family protein [Deinococcus sp. S9]|uniref:MliC family protein n=1 Tax=Deinococcus sp. S9 TaxID=2545754 RepID=UPI0010545577|nr:MliC family protein [Deinococcus sp. S9]TDE87124.1 hypothetical protein E0686_03485 [Deinococcus sp. S9]